ncbi:MAG: FAD-dependent monooxygenase [Acidobacteriaceae bacterium]|nr:FAD-dependent monooxygenase [Acidobacteriaceae bacterium]
MRSATTDVCVVGGGPAGLAAAIALRLKGYSVALFDCAQPPIDKTCGEGLMPESLDALRALGVQVPAAQGFPFHGVCFVAGKTRAAAEFPRGYALGLRRTVLHQLLVERAQEIGVALHWGTKGVRVSREGLSVGHEILRPRLIVGADGQHSTLRHTAGLHRLRYEAQRYGFRRHYKIAPWSPYMELHWGETSQLYITPVAPCEVGVALLSRDPKLRLDRALEQFPEVRARLSAARPTTAETGAVTALRALRRVSRRALALLGDASGSVDAITGEGICLALREALLLADAFHAGDLAQYERAHRALHRRPAAMSRLLLTLARHGTLRDRVIAGFAKRPEVFARFLALHTGQASLFDLCNWSLLHFGFELLAS